MSTLLIAVLVIVSTMLGVISNIVAAIIQPALQPRKKLVLSIFMPLLALTIVLTVVSNNVSNSNNPTKPTLQVKWLTNNVQVEISWRNLPLGESLYLMTMDRNWYYSQKEIRSSSGTERLAPGDRISGIVIVTTPERVPDKVVKGDNSVPIRVIAQAPIPEK